ncbi:MAG: flagellin [Rhizobium sp.]|nr:flagellin [Rhizobium sp.]
MTSILTNISAITALQTLRSLTSDLEGAQGRVSSGLRVAAAADNAAYWSISTTMRSDSMAISAAADALGFGAAKVDTAYAGMTSVIDVLTEFQARLVTATEEGVDKAKVQAELDQMKDQVKSIADSASFSGQNWLTTDIADIYDVDINKTQVVSSFVREGNGGVSTKTMTVDLSKISLFNSTQGGLLQQDARDIETIAGMRYLSDYVDGAKVWSPRTWGAAPATLSNRAFSGPLDLRGVGDAITFDVTVDRDEPSHGISPPYHPGKTSTITIDKAFLDTHFPSWNGVIADYKGFVQALNLSLSVANAGARADLYYKYPSGTVPDKYSIQTRENSGLDGSYIEISNVTSQVSSGSHGLINDVDQAARGSQMTLPFNDFQMFRDGEDPDGIEVSFSFYVNSETPKTYSFDRTYVNNLLGKTNGSISNAGEMVTLLTSLMQADWPDVIISDNGAGGVSMVLDPLADRKAGSKTHIGFSNITVSHEPIPTLNFLDIDIVQNPDMVRTYINYMDKATARVVDGAATLGALQTRIDMQAEFAARLASDIDRGIGRLVDADMNEESTRLKALQTQQQLAVQALSISNNTPDMITQLFR